ncbi:MAG: DUF255 domain-containing protein [Planctomycetaceae bacterium]
MHGFRPILLPVFCLCLAAICAVSVTASAHADEGVEKQLPSSHHHAENHLAGETSPYLLLHAHNPVDWYPWGPEAFEKAQRENKPIFLSIGYSSCYWCHVMERESFSDEEIAASLNEHFVCIKVDREERPDVDDIYMIALQVYQQAIGSSQGGGWPLSMFLTPKGKPMAGGTYFPPTERRGMPGFLSVIKQLQTAWETNRAQMEAAADVLARNVQRVTAPNLTLTPVPLDRSLVDAAVAAIEQQFDPEYGGVGFDPSHPNGPKFPEPTRLMLLQSEVERDAGDQISKFLNSTLDHMLQRGIRDHLGGGFHRYSTDRRWLVPHFEKMLYDNAQLAEVYATEYVRTGDERYLDVAEETFGFVLRQMTDPEGGFYSALDAETDGVEGKHYVWSPDEIATVLSEEDTELFKEVYGIDEPSSFEHGHVLHLPRSLAEVAAERQVSEAELQERLANMRQKLLTVREQRPALLRDDKTLTSWNGLMIHALARGGKLLDRPDLINSAERAANFILAEMRDDEGRLLRTHREDVSKLNAYLDDYAFFVDGLLALHEATGNDAWLTTAKQLTDDQLNLFWDDRANAFFFTSDHHEELLARTKNAYDGVLPSGNSVSVRNLVRLCELTGDPIYRERAQETLEVFAGRLQEQPGSMPFMALALDEYLASDENGTNDAGQTVENESAADSAGTTVTAAKFPQQGADSQAPLVVAARTDPRDRDAKVSAKAYLSVDQISAGGTAQVAVVIEIKKGWHINTNPAMPDFLVPTELTLKSAAMAELSKVVYPKGEDFRMEGFDEPLSVYEEKVVLVGTINAPASAAGQTDEILLNVRYQSCNDRQCLRPTDAKLTFKVPIAVAGAQVNSINQRLFQRIEATP